MTERIDLDDVEVDTEDEESGNEGDWLWRDDDAEAIDGDAPGRSRSDTARSEPDAASSDQSESESVGDSQGDRVPHVPREGSDSPAGIPKDRGGAGAGAGRRSSDEAGQHDATQRTGDDGAGDSAAGSAGGEAGEGRGAASGPDSGDGTASGPDSGGGTASGPHGGGVDEMATAFTYEAVQRLADPRVALAETNEWSDWVGLVGDVPAHAINKFLREHGLDVDFFNGSGDGPGERLAAIDEHSMFYAERMVVVGIQDERWIADQAGWEFVPLSDAAEKAGWSLSE